MRRAMRFEMIECPNFLFGKVLMSLLHVKQMAKFNFKFHGRSEAMLRVTTETKNGRYTFHSQGYWYCVRGVTEEQIVEQG